MGFVTHINELSLQDLLDIAKGTMHCAVSDIDFLETLSTHKCIVVPPWIVQAQPNGGLARVTPLVYDDEGNIDKPRVLLAMAKEFRQAKKYRMGFGDRFS